MAFAGEHGLRENEALMAVARSPVLVHIVGCAAAAAVAAYWGLRLFTPSPSPAPAPVAAAPLRDPDPALAARAFGQVLDAPELASTNIQVAGVFVAGRDSAAVLVVDGHPARAYRLGQAIGEGLRLAEVRPGGVTIDRGGARSELRVPALAVAQSGAPQTVATLEGGVMSAPAVERPAAVPPAPGPGRRDPDRVLPMGGLVPGGTLMPVGPRAK